MTFSLRKGVRFHDGTPLTADLVIASLTRSAQGKIASPALQDIDRMESLDSHTVRLRLKTPSPGLLWELGGHSTRLVLIKNGVPTGTGPYQVKEVRAGRHV